MFFCKAKRSINLNSIIWVKVKGQKYFTDELGKERRTEGFKKYLKSKSKYNVERIPQTELDKAITYYSNKFPDLNEAQNIKKARTAYQNKETI